ncbi:MAG: ABC transporter ATP-binding protein [Deltaproteobacteria bacterium]|nr:ABC transporter ATP-binding protein [Deltaproteobacteria bacterium]
MNNIIEMVEIGRRFDRSWVLAHMNLTIKKGESVALFGANGSGKSTLLKILATLLSPTTGRFQIFGKNPEKEKSFIRRHLRLLGHDKQLYGSLTPLENLRLAARIRGLDYNDKIFESLLGQLQILPFKDQPIGELSEGTKKKLVLAKLLLGDPELILMDEPYPALDKSGREILGHLIHEWRHEGKTLIIASHDHEETIKHVDRVLTLQGGMISS